MRKYLCRKILYDLNVLHCPKSVLRNCVAMQSTNALRGHQAIAYTLAIDAPSLKNRHHEYETPDKAAYA